jgi:hypothetical protein
MDKQDSFKTKNPAGHAAASDRAALAAFAAAHLEVDGRGEVDLGSAFATYRRFCRRWGLADMKRSNFAWALLSYIRPLGGVRSGDSFTGIALIEAVAAPRHEAVKEVAPRPPAPSASRCTLLPAPPLSPNPAIEAVRPAVVAMEGLVERVSEVFGVPAELLQPKPEAAETTAGAGRDDVAAFLDQRLVEKPGFCVSLERLKQVAAEEGFTFREVLARAKARGHEVRKNAWGPDFLTDAVLLEGVR